MAVALNQPYAGYASGTVRQFRTSTETALVAAGLASSSAAALTTGAYTTTEPQGRVSFTIGTASVVITNPNVTSESKIFAVVAQAAADGTLLRVERIVPANGSFTIYGTANATAATLVDWVILNPLGMTPTN
jgi:hypothetical protein